MKYLGVFMMALTLCLSACRHSGEPLTEIDMPINSQFIPEGVKFSENDTEFLEKCKPWNNKIVMVNSVDELPDDPLGFNEGYRNLSFSNQTLIIYYLFHDYNIMSCRSRLYKNVPEDTVNWSITLGIGGDIDVSDEYLMFTRFAILVPKMAYNPDLKVWLGIESFNWSWDD